MQRGYAYILCNRKNGTIYVGATNDLHARLIEHRDQANPKSFTSRYGVVRLVYYESYDLVSDAFARERRWKKYPRQWKINLIEQDNPDWRAIELAYDD